jgi:hypothetical protein
MRVLFDIAHPAHVHVFRHPMALLRSRGHEVVVTSRAKECAVDLLDELGITHVTLSTQGRGGVRSLLRELLVRDLALLRTVRRLRPQVMAAVGGTFVAHAGALTGVPSLVFYDTENAVLQNAITYPLASCVIAPACYQSWLPRRHIRYRGYHELSYLHPAYFTPSRHLAVASGLAAEGHTFLVRLVSWKANHDVGERGWDAELLRRVVGRLAASGRVLISAEGPLPADLEVHRYRGAVSALHHVMAHCRAFVGESATMASECAVLGVPAVYAATTGRGYTDEQEARYGLVRNVRALEWPALEAALDGILAAPPEHWAAARRRLLADTVDVAAFISGCIETFPRCLHDYRQAATAG